MTAGWPFLTEVRSPRYRRGVGKYEWVNKERGFGMNFFKLGIKRKIHPAMIAVWAALIAVSSLLPTFPVFGTGGNFSVGYVLAPLAGIMFGPFAGALTVAIGEFIGCIIAPHVASLGLFTFIINTANAFCAGYLSRKKWQVCFGYIALLTLVWFIIPSGRAAYLYGIVVYGLGLLMAPIGGIFGTKLFSNSNVAKKMVGLFLIVFPCYIAGSITGNIPTLFMYDIPAELWNTFLIWVTPFERTLFSLGATIIGVPLLIGLPKISIYVGPEYDAPEEEDDVDRAVKAAASEGESDEKKRA